MIGRVRDFTHHPDKLPSSQTPPMKALTMTLAVKTIGILGGMSAASTQTYYRTLCDLTGRALVACTRQNC